MTALARVLPVEDAPEVDPFGWGAVRSRACSPPPRTVAPIAWPSTTSRTASLGAGARESPERHSNAQHVVDRLATFSPGSSCPQERPWRSRPERLGGRRRAACCGAGRLHPVPAPERVAGGDARMGSRGRPYRGRDLPGPHRRRAARRNILPPGCALLWPAVHLRLRPQAPDGVVDLDRAIIDTTAGPFPVRPAAMPAS